MKSAWLNIRFSKDNQGLSILCSGRVYPTTQTEGDEDAA